MPETARETPPCPKCQSAGTHRVKRIGLVQTAFFPLLRRYPWRCGVCGSSFTSSDRGKLKRRRREGGETHLPPIR